MGEMVERVARAILAGHDWTGDSTGEPDEPTGWEAMPADWQDAYRNMARAAIEVMREPTEAMVSAGRDQIPAGHGQAWMFVPECYAEMIDAALS